jgi:hypothetical protein
LLISESSIEFLAPGWIKIPSFLQKRGWKNWTSFTDTPLAVRWNRPEGATVFDILTTSPFNNAFNAYMSTFNEGHVDRLFLYLVMQRLAGAKTEKDAVMFGDVGGGLGHQAIAFKKRFPNLQAATSSKTWHMCSPPRGLKAWNTWSTILPPSSPSKSHASTTSATCPTTGHMSSTFICAHKSARR